MKTKLTDSRINRLLPAYSLTGDLLSYLRCGLQYRFHSGSKLPPSRPVQFWFGDFIHGTMERAFLLWKKSSPNFPWPFSKNQEGMPDSENPNLKQHDISKIGDVVETYLKTVGKSPRSADVRRFGYERSNLAINEIGPLLFPLISAAEEPVLGTRSIKDPEGNHKKYELRGVVDVLTEIELNKQTKANPLVNLISEVLEISQGSFEVIVDYKGAKRPPSSNSDGYWEQHEWQIQTYAWLRMQQEKTREVKAGILIYINELLPGLEDIELIKKQIENDQTDVKPEKGTSDYYNIGGWTKGSAVPELSFLYRLKRAVRVIPINGKSQEISLRKFDETVEQIESSAQKEISTSSLKTSWAANGEVDSCETCDFVTFCPNPFKKKKSGPTFPSIP